MRVSIIIPAYRSERFLEKRIKDVCTEAKGIAKDYEVLIVTGNNPDKTLKVAKAIASRNKSVKVVYLPERMERAEPYQ